MEVQICNNSVSLFSSITNRGLFDNLPFASLGLPSPTPSHTISQREDICSCMTGKNTITEQKQIQDQTSISTRQMGTAHRSLNAYALWSIINVVCITCSDRKHWDSMNPTNNCGKIVSTNSVSGDLISTR